LNPRKCMIKKVTLDKNIY